MKKKYIKPLTECIPVNLESQLMKNSKEDQYKIGGSNSQWPQEGSIPDDTGNGPGVSGAKNHYLEQGEWED